MATSHLMAHAVGQSAIDSYMLRRLIYLGSHHGPLWAKVAFMQEVGVHPNCKAGSLCYASTDYRSAVMLIGRLV